MDEPIFREYVGGRNIFFRNAHYKIHDSFTQALNAKDLLQLSIRP